MSKSSAIEFLLGGRGSLCLNSSSFSQISFKTSDFCPGDTLSKVYKVSEIMTRVIQNSNLMIYLCRRKNKQTQVYFQKEV